MGLLLGKEEEEDEEEEEGLAFLDLFVVGVRGLGPLRAARAPGREETVNLSLFPFSITRV